MKESFNPNIAVISAWQPELEALHSMIPNSAEVPLSDDQEEFKCYEGQIHGMNLVYLESGVGMTDSAISTSEVLGKYPTVKYLIVAGVAGALSSDIEIASVSVPEIWNDYSRQLYARPNENGFLKPEHIGKFLQGDNMGFIHPMKTKPVSVSSFMLEVAKRNQQSGRTDINNVVVGGHGLSASIFLDNPQFREFLKSIYPESIIVDMESYAILRAGQKHSNKVQGLAIRTVSDTAGKENTETNELNNEIQRATNQLTLFLDSYLYLFSREI